MHRISGRRNARMSWRDIVQKELILARRELAAAEEGLKADTPAAHSRYLRALHEAELAEHRANHASRHPSGSSWSPESEAGRV
jgi:hypothetical protein